MTVEAQHHEVATAGQAEIDMRFNTPGREWPTDLMLYKYIVKNVGAAARQDRDLHAQAALRRQRLGHAHATSRSGRAASRSSPATATAGMTEMALHYIGGILKHAPALAAFTNPTTN